VEFPDILVKSVDVMLKSAFSILEPSVHHHYIGGDLTMSIKIQAMFRHIKLMEVILKVNQANTLQYSHEYAVVPRFHGD
jgi:hypothetical protein